MKWDLERENTALESVAWEFFAGADTKKRKYNHSSHQLFHCWVFETSLGCRWSIIPLGNKLFMSNFNVFGNKKNPWVLWKLFSHTDLRLSHKLHSSLSRWSTDFSESYLVFSDINVKKMLWITKKRHPDIQLSKQALKMLNISLVTLSMQVSAGVVGKKKAFIVRLLANVSCIFSSLCWTGWPPMAQTIPLLCCTFESGLRVPTVINWHASNNFSLQGWLREEMGHWGYADGI